MKNILIVFMFSIILANYGCVFRATSSADGMTTYDGVSASHKGDAQALAESTAQALSLRYPPGHTSIALVSSPGVFGQTLESALRQKGFAVLPGEQSATVRIAYVLDEIQGEASCYLQVKTSDGHSFGLVRELTSDPGVPITQPPALYPSAEAGLALPERSLPATATPEAPAETLPSAKASLPPYPVRSSATAAQIAKRNKVRVADFCRWNNVAANDPLPAGYRVHLRQPPVAAPVPETPPPAPADAITPVARPLASVPGISPAVEHPLPLASTASGGLTPAPAALPVAAATQPPSLEATVPMASPSNTPETWNIAPGTLRAQLAAWASRAGYQVVWKADHDYDMEAHANFRGDFLSAVQQLFSGLQRVGYPLRVTMYKSNTVMEVQEN